MYSLLTWQSTLRPPPPILFLFKCLKHSLGIVCWIIYLQQHLWSTLCHTAPGGNISYARGKYYRTRGKYLLRQGEILLHQWEIFPTRARGKYYRTRGKYFLHQKEILLHQREIFPTPRGNVSAPGGYISYTKGKYYCTRGKYVLHQGEILPHQGEIFPTQGEILSFTP